MMKVFSTLLALVSSVAQAKVDLGAGFTSSRYKTESNLGEKSYPLSGYYLNGTYSFTDALRLSGSLSYGEGESDYNRSARVVRVFPEFGIYEPAGLFVLGGVGYHDLRELSVDHNAVTGLGGLGVKGILWQEGPKFNVYALYEKSVTASDYEVGEIKVEENKFGNFEINAGLAYPF